MNTLVKICRPLSRFAFFCAALAMCGVSPAKAQTVPWCDPPGSYTVVPSVADGEDCEGVSNIEYVPPQGVNDGYYRWVTTATGTNTDVVDSTAWWEMFSPDNHNTGHHGVFEDLSKQLGYAEFQALPLGYPLGVNLMTTPPAGDFLPPSPTIGESSVSLLPPGAAAASTWWDDMQRPTVDRKIDLVTGLPLVSTQDLALPFGGATFRLNRTRSAKHPIGRLGNSDIYASQGWWDWVGEGWMASENPFLVIDSAIPDLVGDRPLTCSLWLDAHHSIPFQLIESNDQYAAPPRFRARMEHNGDRANGIEPTQFEVWLYDGQLKYTFVVVPGDIPPNLGWDPAQSPITNPPAAGTTTLHDRPYAPDQVFAADPQADWHDPWDVVENPGIGVPSYALCVKVEDRFGHAVETTYHDVTTAEAYDGGGTDCAECSQESRRKGMIKTITLSTNGTTNWTLVYRHRMLWRGLAGELPPNWGSASLDTFREAFAFPVIDRIYAFEHDENGNGITSAQIDALDELIVLEESLDIDDPQDLDISGPLDTFAHDAYTTSTNWTAVESDLRYIVGYHYDTRDFPVYGAQDATLVKTRMVRIGDDNQGRTVSSKVFKYTPKLIEDATHHADNVPKSEQEIAWLELVFTESDLQAAMDARGTVIEVDATTSVTIPTEFTPNYLALWRRQDPNEDKDMDQDEDLAGVMRSYASLVMTPGLYEMGSAMLPAWPSGSTWDAPSPVELISKPAGDKSAYIASLGEDLTARNDGNWSTVGTASLRDSDGTERHYRFHRLMAFPVTPIDFQIEDDGVYVEWEAIDDQNQHIRPNNLNWSHYTSGAGPSDEADKLDYFHASGLVNPYYYRSYERLTDDPLVAAGDLTKPRWIVIVDEYGSREEMMESGTSYGGDYLIKDGQMGRRVVEINAFGYILKDRTWTYTDDGYIREGGGLGEEFAYLSVRDYIDKANLSIPGWLDDGSGEVSDSGDFSPFLDDVVMVEHRSVGWSVAEYDDGQPGALESDSNGIVRFIEYDLFGDGFSLDDVPLSVRFQKTAEGIRKGTYYLGEMGFNTGSANDPLLYTRQYFRDPCRPGDITTDIAFSGEIGATSKLTSPPDIDQTPDPSVTMTRVLSAYDENASTSGDSYLDDPLVARMVIGSPRQVRPGSPWFYPVEFEHYDGDGLSDWTATGQLEEPINNSATDYANLTSPVLTGNTSDHNSLTWTHYSRNRDGLSDYTVLDAGAGDTISLTTGSVSLPGYPSGWLRFGSVTARNFVTEFKYDSDYQLSDVYYPNGMRWARRTYSYDQPPEDDVIDYVYEFIFNDLVEVGGAGSGNYVATSPGQYKLYKGEDAYGTPEHDKRVRFPDTYEIDGDVAEILAQTIIDSEDPNVVPAVELPYELMAEVLFAVDANGRLQRADMMDYDPLGRPMAIGYTEINDLGELYRERGIDGTIRTQIRNSLGQTLRRYEGTVDRDWYGDPNQTYFDNMVMKERIEYGLGVNDAWMPTTVYRYEKVPDWDGGGYDDHFLQAPSLDKVGIPTVTKYDWRMRPVMTQSLSQYDESNSTYHILSTSVTYLDHADRPVLEVMYGAGDPALPSTHDPSGFEQAQAVPSPDSFFALTPAPTSVVKNIYGPDGTLVERRTYDTDWDGTGTLGFTSEIMLNGLGGQPVYSQSVANAADVTRIDNLGRTAEVASIVPGTISGSVDGYELTRTDSVFDADGNVTEVFSWERVINDTDPVLSETNAVCSRTVNWYDEKKRLIATADLGTEDAGGAYKNADPNDVYDISMDPDVPHYLPATNNLSRAALPDSARLSIYVYGDGDPSPAAAPEEDEQMTHMVSPNGMVTYYEYTGTGQIWRKVENITAPLEKDRRCTQYEYRYGKVQQIIAYDAYPNPPNLTDADSDGFIDNVDYQQTIVAYDNAFNPSTGPGGLDQDNINGDYGAVVVDDGFNEVSRDGSLITTVHLPDPSTGEVSEISQTSLDATETFRLKYTFSGQIAERIDAEDRSFRYTYDDLGRLLTTQVGWYSGQGGTGTYTLGYEVTTNVPADRVVRIEYAYDDYNRTSTVTAKALDNSIISQNKYEYDGRGNITREYQQYGSAVDIADSPFLEYVWDYKPTEYTDAIPIGAQVLNIDHPGYDRLASIRYPVPQPTQTSRLLTFGYGSTNSHTDKMSWLETVDSNLGSPQVALFGYTGNGRRIGRSTAGGEISWTLKDGSDVALDAVDSFGRIWVNSYTKTTAGSILYRGQHTYNSMGSRLASVIQQAYYTGTSGDERSRVNTYSMLGQLTGTKVGVATWDTGGGAWEILSPDREDNWVLDNLGNWAGDGTNPGRRIHGDLDSAGNNSQGFWTWGDDGTADTLEFTHATNARNEINSLIYDFDGQTPTSDTPVYDDVGNLANDQSYIYHYDAWNRVVQIDSVAQSGKMVRHYTYDGLGRLIKTTSPNGQFDNRVEHHHYDGVRRVQTHVVSSVFSGGGAEASGNSQMSQMAAASEPSGESTDPENTNLAFGGGQVAASGTARSIWREYVWGPGDMGVDEALVYYDASDEAWWCLTDLTGDLVAVCDLDSSGDARVVAQWTYDAYGGVMSADHLHSFQKPDIGHKGLFMDRLDIASPTGHQLAPFAHLIYHNRNRAYIPMLGRFLQMDPNAGASVLAGGAGIHGVVPDSPVVGFDLQTGFVDGANRYQYLKSNPWMSTDPAGLFVFPGAGDFITGALSALVEEYSARQEWDVEWATDWDMPDDIHSRTENDWVKIALIRGAYDAYSMGIPGIDIEFNLLDPAVDLFGGFGSTYAAAGRGFYRQRMGLPGGRYASYTRRIQVDGHYILIYNHRRYSRNIIKYPKTVIKKQVRIVPTGSPDADIKKANEMAGKGNRHYNWVEEFGEPYTWHHDVVRGRMQLVPRRLHSRTGLGHVGGGSMWYE